MTQQIPENMQNDVQASVAQALKEEKKKRRKKKWIIVACVLVGIIIIAGIAGGNSDDTPTSNQVEPISGSNSTTAAPSESRIVPGNSVSTDTVKISYISCNSNAKDYNEYATVQSGNKVIRADFEFENISDTDQFLNNIDCYADGTKCESFYSGNDYKSPALEKLSPGRKTTAVVYFEVPKDAQEIELEIEDDYWKNTKILFVVE